MSRILSRLWFATGLLLTLLTVVTLRAESLPAGLQQYDCDSLLAVWSGRDLPEYLLLRGHSAEAAGNDSGARGDWINFLDRYPFHPHTSYIHYRLGRNYAAAAVWEAAADHLLPVLQANVDSRLTGKAATSLCELYQRLDPGPALELLQIIPPDLATRCRQEAATERGTLYLLPLSGEHEEEGRDLMRSIRIGREIAGLKDGRLRVLDNRSDPLLHAQLLGELSGDRDWLVFQRSDPAMLAPLQLLPRVMPICPDLSLPAAGTLNSISLHLDPVLQARTLAEWAWDSLGLRSYAILAPADSFGYSMTREFTRVIESRGDTILFSHFYFPGSDDISKQLEELRRSGQELDFLDSLSWSFADTHQVTIEDRSEYADLEFDTLLVKGTPGLPTTDWYHLEPLELPADTTGQTVHFRLFSRDGTVFRVSPAAELPLPPEIMPDLFTAYERRHPSKNTPVKSIDAVFFPIYREDARHMATQLAFYHFDAQLLGSEYWVDWGTRKEGGALLKGMLATLPFLPGEQVERFVVEFYNATYRYPTLDHLLASATPLLLERLQGLTTTGDACLESGLALDPGFVFNPGMTFSRGLNVTPRLCRFDGESWHPVHEPVP